MTERRRLRELGIAVGTLQPGPLNAITDVAGVQVGHATIIQGHGPLEVGVGPICTGVTAILPNGGDIFDERISGGGFILNGAGEFAGMTQVMEWGLIETPLLLTSTLSVGICSDALVKWMIQRHEGIGQQHDVIIPLVGECDDSWLNDAAGGHVRQEHAFAALRDASPGLPAEGNVGGGAGMITCDLKGGIGTSSRLVDADGLNFTVGVLVMSNFGWLRQLRVDGLPFGRWLDRNTVEEEGRRRVNYGSIICVVATDAPLTSHQLNRLSKRAALGIGRCGSTAAHGSGEIVISFSTANTVPRVLTGRTYTLEVLANALLNNLYDAVVDATEEAILNALCMAEPLEGRDGRFIPALPLDMLVDYMARHRD